jgi:AraC-like DNA-binding protein
MSRCAFSARFTELVGQPAMRYLAEWWLRLARAQLIDTRETVAMVAKRAGYQSEAASGRAFKQLFGVPPGGVESQLPRRALLCESKTGKQAVCFVGRAARRGGKRK